MGPAFRFLGCFTLLAASLSGCCLDVITGSTFASSTGGATGTGGSSGSTTGVNDSGPVITMLWIGGVGAIDPSKVPQSGTVPFVETCPSPEEAPDAGFRNIAVIDGAGNLWARGSPNPAVYVWTPEQLAQSCASGTPAITLTLTPFVAMAFDAEGNLWGSGFNSPADPQVLGYRAADLKVSGTPAPAWKLTGVCNANDPVGSLCDASGLAFDSDDTLWLAAGTAIHGFLPSTRTGPDDGGIDGTGPPADFNFSATYCDDLAPSCFGDLAFDSAGALWIASAFQILAYSRAQLENVEETDFSLGTFPLRDLSIVATPDGGGVPTRVPWFHAFDADGNLWVGCTNTPGEPNLVRLPRESLALDAGPSLTVASPDILIAVPGSPEFSLAFSPIPPGLPIQP